MSGALSTFARDSALDSLGAGRHRASLNRNWWVVAGPNGGLIAALMVRAVDAELDDPARTVRSITIHYLDRPVEGDAELAVHAVRSGRSVSFLRVDMSQDGRPVATASVVAGTERQGGLEWEHRPSPVDHAAVRYENTAEAPEVPFRERWRHDWCVGVPGHPHTNIVEGYHGGGWIRLAEPTPYDVAHLAAMADAWPPGVMMHSDAPVHTPTLELTIHVRRDPASLGLDPDEAMFAVFRQSSGADGYLDETGEIWTPGGELLVLCRQLAIVLPRPDGQPGPGRDFRPIPGQPAIGSGSR